MKRRIYQIAMRVLILVLVSLLGALLSATMVRFAPGYEVDERELDPRLSPATLQSIRAANHVGLLSYYTTFLAGAIHGDLGNSRWLQRPVKSLIRERFPVTLHSVLVGTFVAWITALLAALTVAFFRKFALEITGTLLTGVLIALPTAVVAAFAVYAGASVSAALTVVLFPKLFRYLRNLFAHAQAQPHVLAAQARGIGGGRILFRHVLVNVSPALLALLGVSLSMAFGAAIPIEALCDSPGIGQLAWQAAINRDLPLITNLTLLVTMITVVANWLANFGDRRVV